MGIPLDGRINPARKTMQEAMEEGYANWSTRDLNNGFDPVKLQELNH